MRTLALLVALLGADVPGPFSIGRSDTFTVTGAGTTVSTASRAVRSYSIAVKGTGGAAQSWDVRLEGSLDGANFTTLLTHNATIGDGVVLGSGAQVAPVTYLRSRANALNLGSATNIVVTIVGTF